MKAVGASNAAYATVIGDTCSGKLLGPFVAGYADAYNAVTVAQTSSVVHSMLDVVTKRDVQVAASGCVPV
jgi:hypothetical protein